MKKILIISQHYYPENFRITDIAETLVKYGNNVTVITGYPNYPLGKIYNGYTGKGRKEHKHEIINGVNIIRCYEHPRKHNPIDLFLNYYSVSLSMKRCAKKIKEKYDYVFINQLSPVMQAWAGIAYAKKYNVKCYLYCYDLWPDSLIAGGIKKNSLVYKYYYKVSNKIYKSVDKIYVTSNMFIDYFKKFHGINEEKLTYLPQYCEELFSNVNDTNENKNTYDYVFAGNVGNVQSVETIIKAANIIKNDNTIRIHIVGDGSDLENCKKLASKYNLNNVVFYGKKPITEMPKFYSMASAMLVTLFDDEIISRTLPGKVQSYMAAGKPIIASANGETQYVMEKARCGMYCNAEDYESLANIMIKMKSSNLIEYSKNSKNYYEKNFRKELFLETLKKEIDNSRKVVLFTPFKPSCGGIATWANQVIEYNDKNNFIDIIPIRIGTMKINGTNKSKFKRIFYGLENLRSVLKETKKIIYNNKNLVFHINVIGGMSIYRDYSLIKLARKSNIPIVLHIRFGRIPIIYSKRNLEWKLINRNLNYSNKIICIDSNTYNAIHNIYNNKTELINNLIDSENFDQRTTCSDKFRIIFVGWIINTKGVEELIEAFSLLKKDCANVELNLIGPYENDYLNYLHNKYDFSCINVYGKLNNCDVKKMLLNSDVFVLPSYTEGFPNSVLEAMVSRVPVIATNVGAIPSILSNNCGIVINPKKYSEIYDSLKKIMKNKKMTNLFIENAYNKVMNEYDIKIIFKKYLKIWNNI